MREVGLHFADVAVDVVWREDFEHKAAILELERNAADNSEELFLAVWGRCNVGHYDLPNVLRLSVLVGDEGDPMQVDGSAGGVNDVIEGGLRGNLVQVPAEYLFAE